MFNIGFSELVILGILGLLILGPDQLPQVARKVARMLNDFKRVTQEAMSPVNELKSKAQDLVEHVRKDALPKEDPIKEGHKDNDDFYEEGDGNGKS